MAGDPLLGRAVDSNRKRIYLPHEDRQQHLHVLGRFSLGKSKFLEHLLRHDIAADHGVCLIDPHGSLCDAVVKWCAHEGYFDRRTIYVVKPAERAWSFGFNPLDLNGLDHADFADAIDNMVKATAQAWGGEDMDKTPRMARVLAAVYHALAASNMTLHEALDLLQPGNAVRGYVASRVTDPIVRAELESLYSLPPAKYVEQVESTQNRLARFLRNPLARTMVSLSGETIDFARAMDEGHVVLVNLHGLTEQTRRLVGSLMVNDIATKARLRRPDVSREFFVYIDECYEFLNSDIEAMITGLRKFGIRLTLAHQNLGQLKDKAGEAVYSAVRQMGTKVIFGGLPAAEAEELVLDLFVGTFDFEKPKHVLDKPTVVEYQRTFFHHSSTTRSSSTSIGTVSGSSETSSEAFDDSGDRLSQAIAAAVSDAASETTTEGISETEGWSEGLEPVLETLPTAVYSPQELVWGHMGLLINQPTRCAVVKRPNKAPVPVVTPWVDEPLITNEYVEERLQEVYAATPFARRYEEASQEIEARRERLLGAAKEHHSPTPPDEWEG